MAETNEHDGAWVPHLIGEIERISNAVLEREAVGFMGSSYRVWIAGELGQVVRQILTGLRIERGPLRDDANRVARDFDERSLAIQQSLDRTNPALLLLYAAFEARAAARASIGYDEPRLTDRGELELTPTGAVSALVLFAVMRLRHVARVVLEAHVSAFQGPFRRAGSVDESVGEPQLQPPRLQAQMLQALFFTTVLDGWQNADEKEREGNPFSFLRPLEEPLVLEARRRAMKELDQAKWRAVSTAPGDLVGGAYALEAVRRLSALAGAAAPSDIRVAMGAVDELANVLSQRTGIVGEVDDFLLEAYASVEDNTVPRSILERLKRARDEGGLSRRGNLANASAPWVSLYFLATLVAPQSRPHVSFFSRFRQESPEHVRAQRWQALRTWVEQRFKPTSREDHETAAFIVRAMDGTEAGLYFSLSSLRAVIGALRDDLSLEAPIRTALSPTEIVVLELVLTAWCPQITAVYGALRQHGQIFWDEIRRQLRPSE
ncbi:MAG: hypothetical protein U0271_09835 [Polyangiaceae bacterium]